MDKVKKYMHEPISVFAVQDKDKISLKRSSSGGAFMVLARKAIENGGVVFGVALDSRGNAHYCSAADIGELKKLQGSKYVYASLENSFKEVSKLLREGKLVFFSGLPCQVFALKFFLEMENNSLYKGKLITCDLICHGTLRKNFFPSYIQWLEGKLNALPGSIKYSFRSKKVNWGKYFCEYSYVSMNTKKRKSVLCPSNEDLYCRAYFSGNYFRKACYSCLFAKSSRVADITIGDYWGIKEFHPDFYSKLGVSAVMLNTKEGKCFFDEFCLESCRWTESTIERVCKYNLNLNQPSSRSAEAELFSERVYTALDEGKLDLVFSKYLSESGLKFFLKKIIPNKILYLVARII